MQSRVSLPVQHRTASKNARRGGAAVTAVGPLGLAIVVGGCSSGAAKAHNPLSTSATIPPSATSSAASSTPPANTSSSTQPDGPQADGYWFTTTERFPGGAQWHLSVRPPTHPTDGLGLGGEGEIQFDGPNQAEILFDSPIHIGQFETLTQEINADVTTRQIKLDGAPQSMDLGGAAAAIASGTTSTGKHVDLITAMNPSSHAYTDVTLTCTPAGLTTDRTVLQALLHSFRFEH